MNEVAAYTRLAGVYDEIVVDPCYAKWAEFLDGLWSRDLAGVHDVLDVCCGTGLMAAELLARDYSVVGVDSSDAMLNRARALVGTTADFHRVVLPDLPIDGIFDAAISNFDGLNYVSPADFAATLRQVAAHLRPGGWFVFDLHTDSMMDFTAANSRVSGESDGHNFVITSDVDVVERKCITTIDVTPGDGSDAFTEVHTQYFHADPDVYDALYRADFADLQVLDEYTYRPCDQDTLRATWIARRQ